MTAEILIPVNFTKAELLATLALIRAGLKVKPKLAAFRELQDVAGKIALIVEEAS